MTPDRRIARAARRANARALEKFVADGAEGANVPRELRVVKRATTALFLALGLDIDRSMFLRGEFVADALRGGGSPRAFLETSKSMMTTFRLVVGLRDATRLMTRENDGRGALAVCEAACGDQTLASVVLVLLRSYAERYGGDAAADDYARNPSSVVKLLTGNAASSTLAGAIFHQVMTGGSIPAVMMSRGTRVRVEDVDEPSSPADSRFSKWASPRTPASLVTTSGSDETEATTCETSEGELSDSDSDVIIVGEFKAPKMSPSRKSMRTFSMKHWSEQTLALGLRVRDVIEDGNCCFRSISHGVKVLAKEGCWDAERGGLEWNEIRATMCDRLDERKRRMDDPRDVLALHNLLLNGKEGRDYLRRGKLKRSSDDKRWKVYLRHMRADAAKYAATTKWTRYWGTDAELCAIATLNDVAIVCVEASEEETTVWTKTPFYVATPDLATRDEPIRMAPKYHAGGVCDGVNVRWNTKKWTLTLHVGPSKKMRAARDKCRGSRHAGAIPALAVKHFPGHFEALVPERDGDIVWIEYARRART